MRIQNRRTGTSCIRKLRKRLDIHGHARELTFSCYHGFQFLKSDRTCQWFVDALQAARQAYALDLWAYVIMPEHVHLLVYPREPGMELGPIAGEIKSEVGARAVRFIKQHAPEWLPRITVREGKRLRHRFWQPGGGYDRNGVVLETVLRMIDYIHANPVRRNLVSRPEDWYWSSAGWYAGRRPVPIEMDRTIPDTLYLVK